MVAKAKAQYLLNMLCLIKGINVWNQNNYTESNCGEDILIFFVLHEKNGWTCSYLQENASGLFTLQTQGESNNQLSDSHVHSLFWYISKTVCAVGHAALLKAGMYIR